MGPRLSVQRTDYISEALEVLYTYIMQVWSN